MSPNEWVGLSVGLIGMVGAIYSAIRFLVKSIMRELLPNGGNSLRDEIRTVSARVDQIFIMLSKNVSE